MTEKENVTHPDDEAVDRFAAAMKTKLAKKRAEGRGGWEGSTCSQAFLSELLVEHVAKGDPVDVANLAMMLHQRGESIAALTATPQEAAMPAEVFEGLSALMHEHSFTNEEWERAGEDVRTAFSSYFMRQAAIARAISEDSHE